MRNLLTNELVKVNGGLSVDVIIGPQPDYILDYGNALTFDPFNLYPVVVIEEIVPQPKVVTICDGWICYDEIYY